MGVRRRSGVRERRMDALRDGLAEETEGREGDEG